ncbi:MAG: hypothetical protein KF716_06370 [Anaerolineae bacterium]|nr:hypothetical protein [Anaerolineae bacterium]
MFNASSSKRRRAGIFYVLTISLTLLLLAASSIPTSAQPTTLEEEVRMQTTKLSNQDKTATARAKKASEYPRNRRAYPTATVMSDGADLIFGPDSGELVSADDGTRKPICAEVDVRNFIVHFRMYNPAGNADWEYGVDFRKVTDGDAYFWFLYSRGQWAVARFEGGDLNSAFSNLRLGSVPNMDRKPNGFNDITIAVQEDLMLVSVNGEYLTYASVAQLMDSGDVCIVVDNFSSLVRDGRSFQYENFTIEELP